MQSKEKSISRVPTRVLYIPQLPALLANWKLLKSHFSQYGNIDRVILNPQERSCTVSFETIADAERAKSKGCVWNGQILLAVFVDGDSGGTEQRTRSGQVLGYSELDSLWSDEDMDKFGEYEYKPDVAKEKQLTKKSSRKIKDASLERKSSDLNVRVSKTKLSRHPKLGLSTERNISRRSSNELKTKAMALYSDKEKHKEMKKKIKEALIRRKESIRTSVKSMDTVKTSSNSLVLSAKEKFKLLEERDKDIRRTIVKSSNVKTAKSVIGTCPDMCPEKERMMRESRRLVSVFEMVPNTDKMDHTIAVKAYSRSSADQEEPLPHELRPEPVLSMTMSYLISKIMPLIEGQVNASEWYDFCWDRLRSIRKDIIQQRLCNLETVRIIEQCARFHICCYDRLWGADPATFDEKINTENLMNCLQMLRHMYEDLSKENVKCLNQAEFNAYMIILNMKTGDLMATYQRFSEKLQKEERIQEAVKFYLTLNNAMYSQFFKLVKHSSYLVACLLQRYFYHVRVQALQTIATAYCPPNKGASIPLTQMKKLLKFDTAEDTVLFCEGHGILLKDNERDFSLYRNDFFFPETKIILETSSSLVTNKRLPISEAVVGNDRYRMRRFKTHQIHSSFTDDGKLHEMASDASDQKSKSSIMLMKLADDDGMDVESRYNESSDERSSTVFSFNQSSQEENYMDEDDGVEEDEELYEKDIFPSMDVDNAEGSNQQDTNFYDTGYTESKQLIPEKSGDNDDSGEQPRGIPFSFDLNYAKTSPKDFTQTQPSSNKTIFGSTTTGISDTNYQLPSNQFSFKLDLSKSTTGGYAQSQNNIFQTPESLLKPIRTVDNPQVSPKPKFASTNENEQSTGSNSSSFTFTLKDPSSFNSSPKNNLNSFFGSSSFTEDQIDSRKTFNKYSGNLSNFELASKKESSVSPVAKKMNENRTEFGLSEVSKRFYEPVEMEKSYEEEVADEIRIREEIEVNNRIKEQKREELRRLRSEVKGKLRTVRSRYFIKKWRNRVEKMKQIRKDFPVLIGGHIDDIDYVWGSSYNSDCDRSLLNRLEERRQTTESVDLILNIGLHNKVLYMGKEVAENVSINNIGKLNIRDFHVPVYWKLVVSIPFMDDDFYVQKINSWLQKVFYRSENLILGSVTEEMSSQNVPVYYCVHLLMGNDFREHKDKINGMSSLLFFSIDGVECLSDKLRRFDSLISSNLSLKPTNVALVNIGKELNNDDAMLTDLMNFKINEGRITKGLQQYWADFVSIKQVVTFFTSNVDLSNDSGVCTLDTLFRRLSEHIVNFLRSAEIVSENVSSDVTNPNFVIDCYNSFFTSLEQLVMNSDINTYDIVPPDFKDLVRYLHKTSQFVISFNQSRSSEIVEAFSTLKLPKIKRWPPKDDLELLDSMRSLCDSVECANVLPKLVRFIDVNDDDSILENINKVSWINLVDLLVKEALDVNSEFNKQCIVLCNESDILNMFQIDFSFKLLYNNS